MSTQQYEVITVLQPPNPSRAPVVVHICQGCGGLVGDMAAHDAHHEAIAAAAKATS